MLKFILNTLNLVSTKPNPLSYKWHNSLSILSFILLHVVYIARGLSLLQWSKYVFRIIASKRKSKDITTDKRSKRINVPSIFVEVYYIILGCLLYALSVYNLTHDSIVVQIVAIYFLIDTSVWLLYYFFLRRFYEEDYAIMHVLEYIVLLPLVIVCQGCCVSIVSDVDFSRAISMLFLPTVSNATYILVINIVYSALIFGLIISNLPIERVKVKNSHKYDIAIIGNGDVVQNRLVPAIIRYANYTEQFIPIAIFDVCISHHPIYDKFCNIYYLNITNNIKDVLNSKIVWIATPSYAHYTYLGQMIFTNKFIVIEKPLTVFQQELNSIKALRAQAWDKVFCLSYYYLEKALPLSYLYHPLDFYSRYIEISSTREHLLSSMKNAGALKSIRLYLNEAEDNREWLKDNTYGGQYFETFIHLVVMAKSVLGKDDEMAVTTWEIGDCQKAKGSYIKCHAQSTSGVDVYLEMGKFVTPQREGRIEYENGILQLDFNKQTVECLDKNGNSIFHIKTKDTYGKYDIQLDMVKRCVNENIKPSAIDGSEIQIDALQWLMDNQPNHIEHFQY